MKLLPSDAALLLDLYELTMASSYLAHDMRESATFDLFVRRLPRERNFLVACGIDRALAYLETLHFDEEAIDRLKRLGQFDASFLEMLGTLRFTGEVWAVPEGELVLDEEPILRVTAPIAEAQLVETFLLNCVLFETMIASKAARVTLAAQGRSWSEFGMRRAHGADAALRGARAAWVGGATSTSDVLAACELGIPPSGTMAHSFVLSFDSELDSFRLFAHDHGERSVLLIDTWDTSEGARHAARVGVELKPRGERLRAVRIDSGDFLSASREVRTILDEAGLEETGIVLSGDLDEREIQRLLGEGAPVDGFGVGTQVSTSADAPSLGGVYKLSDYAGVPRMKFSEHKVTLPGKKQVHRVEENGHWVRDVISLEDETVESSRPLLEPVMKEGRRISAPGALREARERCGRRLASLPPPLCDLDKKSHFPVERSAGLERLMAKISRNHFGVV
jgi:nicotinate phosphoribosyltransferase